MSPKWDNRFAGHMENLDPRTPFFGCAGCTWPTVPGWHLFLGSDDATGALAWLNTIGIQLQIGAPPHDPKNLQWIQNGGAPPILDVFLLKNEVVDPYGYIFSGVITTVLGFVEFSQRFPEKTCNCCHPLPNVDLGAAPVLGTTGDTFRLLQVEWDQERPPGGFP